MKIFPTGLPIKVSSLFRLPPVSLLCHRCRNRANPTRAVISTLSHRWSISWCKNRDTSAWPWGDCVSCHTLIGVQLSQIPVRGWPLWGHSSGSLSSIPCVPGSDIIGYGWWWVTVQATSVHHEVPDMGTACLMMQTIVDDAWALGPCPYQAFQYEGLGVSCPDVSWVKFQGALREVPWQAVLHRKGHDLIVRVLDTENLDISPVRYFSLVTRCQVLQSHDWVLVVDNLGISRVSYFSLVTRCQVLQAYSLFLVAKLPV